ncbi:hypothetical protein DFH27DRAFT_570242 [Peziza echinospora]|nr:hypothetical protein DFH27DRAFT_570242 [Peziza echinospora]
MWHRDICKYALSHRPLSLFSLFFFLSLNYHYLRPCKNCSASHEIVSLLKFSEYAYLPRNGSSLHFPCNYKQFHPPLNFQLCTLELELRSMPIAMKRRKKKYLKKAIASN